MISPKWVIPPQNYPRGKVYKIKYCSCCSSLNKDLLFTM